MHDLRVCLHWKCPLNRQPSMKNTQTLVRKSPHHQRQEHPPLAVSLGHRHHSKGFPWIDSLHLHNCPMKLHLSYRWGNWGTERCTHKWDSIFGNLTSGLDPYQFWDPSHELSFLDELSWAGRGAVFVSPVSPPSPSHLSPGMKKQNTSVCRESP